MQQANQTAIIRGDLTCSGLYDEEGAAEAAGIPTDVAIPLAAARLVLQALPVAAERLCIIPTMEDPTMPTTAITPATIPTRRDPRVIQDEIADLRLRIEAIEEDAWDLDPWIRANGAAMTREYAARIAECEAEMVVSEAAEEAEYEALEAARGAATERAIEGCLDDMLCDRTLSHREKAELLERMIQRFSNTRGVLLDCAKAAERRTAA